jgi:hypothetical protein
MTLRAIFNLINKLNGVFVLKNNVGKVDQFIRIILGLALLSSFILLDGGMRYLGIAGIVLVLTSVLKFCPLYTLFGITSIKKNA